MNQLYLLTGGNMGDRLQHLQQALAGLQSQVGKLIKKSAVYETAPWGKTDQASFLNQVLVLATALSPAETLQTILDIEEKLGRKRLEKNGPRTIDIDILLYGHEVISTPQLQVPHPQMQNRRFVLTPLSEVAAGFIHPVLQQTIAELLAVCPDDLPVAKYAE